MMANIENRINSNNNIINEAKRSAGGSNSNGLEPVGGVGVVNEDKPKVAKPKPPLLRTTSVGKLVNSFENGQIGEGNSSDEGADIDDYDASSVRILSRTTSPASIMNNNGYSKKPPLATKPILRHTVSSVSNQKR